VASLVFIAFVTAVAGILFGAFLKICFAISREDRRKGALRSAARNSSARSARFVVGINGSERR
jgi:hypothetical protein